MEMTPAVEADIEPVLNTINAISSWLKNKGIHQWSDAFPRTWIEGEISRGELFVHRDYDEVAASLVLSFTAGDMWGQSEGAAIYIHRVAVNRAYTGRQLGRAIIAWAEREAHHKGIPLLRLECDLRNEILQDYYKSLGFQDKGTVHHAGYNMDFARFEKRIV